MQGGLVKQSPHASKTMTDFYQDLSQVFTGSEVLGQKCFFDNSQVDGMLLFSREPIPTFLPRLLTDCSLESRLILYSGMDYPAQVDLSICCEGQIMVVLRYQNMFDRHSNDLIVYRVWNRAMLSKDSIIHLPFEDRSFQYRNVNIAMGIWVRHAQVMGLNGILQISIPDYVTWNKQPVEDQVLAKALEFIDKNLQTGQLDSLVAFLYQGKHCVVDLRNMSTNFSCRSFSQWEA